MPYQTGSATGPVDLLQQLATWLNSVGWTQDRNASEGSGWTYSGHRGGNYVHLRATVNETGPWQSSFGSVDYGLHMYMGTGFSSGSVWNAQTTGSPVASGGSNPIGVGMKLSAGPFSNYYFFSDSTGDNIVVVVEKTPGLYLHLCWGTSLLKSGTWTGGPYFCGSTSGYYTSYPSAAPNTPGFTSTSDCPFAFGDQIGGGCGFVRADVDSWTGKWVSIWENASGANQGDTGKHGGSASPTKNLTTSGGNFPHYQNLGGGVSYDFENLQTSALDGRANLLPLYLWTLRDGTSTGFSLLGRPPFIFFSNAIGNGFTAASEYTIGGTTYKLFPNFAVVKQ